MAQAQRRLKARYRTVGPKVVDLEYTHCHIDESGSLVQEQRTRRAKTWMVYMPAGHSIRVEEAELKRLGFHLKPRIIDLDTGDVVDLGGDPYDMGPELDEEVEDILGSDDEGVVTKKK